MQKQTRNGRTHIRCCLNKKHREGTEKDLLNYKLEKDYLAAAAPDIAKIAGREWIITNGLGGFASGTPFLINTRKYHGLLTAAFNPPTDRFLMLSKIEEEISTSGEEFFLASNLYSKGKVIQPAGYRYLESFELGPDPVFTYRVEGKNFSAVITKKIFMPYQTNSVIIKYEVISCSGPFTIKLYPLVTCRDFHGNTDASVPGFEHGITHSNLEMNFIFRSAAFGEKKLRIFSDRAAAKQNENWSRGLFLAREASRGENPDEDLLCPGRFTLKAKVNDVFHIAASADDIALKGSFASLEKKNSARYERIQKDAQGRTDFIKKLTYSADSFIVGRSSTGKKTVIAGYHWFTDWGRDTMISLAGLTLVTGRFDACREVLLSFSENIRDGLIPNRFPDRSSDSPEYNTVDASLWFFYAVYKYYIYTGDKAFVEKLLPAMRSIIKSYAQGTIFGIRMDPTDLLVSHGEKGYQLTWMDAKTGDRVITPRAGKAVEINALWYNALSCLRFFELETASGRHDENSDIIKGFKDNFLKRFSNPAGGLYDIVDELGDSGALKNAASLKIRPNQIFAASLPFTALGEKEALSVVAAVEKNLFTPFGLRSLAPSDPEYTARYEGTRLERDAAYHQGTVWAYLMGPFITAKLRAEKYSGGSLEFCRSAIQNFERHLNEAGIFSISEIFDGDAPHRPHGCISQAWSVAEILRAVHEDIEGNMRPEKFGQ